MSGADDLERFVMAQAPVYDQVLDELRAGHKRSHWMWFVFPQLRGLGHSDMARRYGVADLAEARAYLAHPVLGPRLHQCLGLVLAASGSAEDIMGPVDAVKLRSCVTLVQQVEDDPTARAILERWWDGTPDAGTLELLARRPSG